MKSDLRHKQRSFINGAVFFKMLAALALIIGFAALAVTLPASPGKTLQANLNSEVDNLIAKTGSTPDTALNTFSSADDVKLIYKRNTSVWTGGLNWTGVVASHPLNGPVGVHNSYVVGGGALITPQDMVGAAHFAVGNIQINFVDANNEVHSATIIGQTKIEGTDIQVMHFSSPLPSSIKYYKILPDNYCDYTPDYALGSYPILLLLDEARDTEKKAYVLDSVGHLLASGEIMYTACTEKDRAPYTWTVNSGSGSPAFVVINGEPVLLGCLHTTASFSNLTAKAEAINVALKSLGSTYQLTTVDLSGFVYYSRN